MDLFLATHTQETKQKTDPLAPPPPHLSASHSGPCWPAHWRFVQDFTEHVFDAARAPSSASFHYHMDRLKEFKPDSYAALMKHPHASWANYACRRNITWDQVTTNTMTSGESADDVIGKEVSGQWWWVVVVMPRKGWEGRLNRLCLE